MKKQITLWMAVIMLFGTITMFAQKPFAGTIVFEYTAVGTDDPNINSQLAQLKNELTIMGNCTKTVADMGISVTNITNGDYKFTTTIYDIPGYGKYYIEQDEKEITKAFEKSDIKIEYAGETKTICDYNCKKVNVSVTDKETDEVTTIVLWVTEDLLVGENLNFDKYPGLKGVPLCTEITTDQTGEEITIVCTATSVTPNKKIKSTNFLRPSDSTPLKDAPEDIKKALGYEE